MSDATGDGNQSQPSTSSSSAEWSHPCRQFEYPEILLATQNFDEQLVIGRGGFGKVYKGTVLNGSTPVVAAIKRLDSNSNQGAPEFWAEVKMLSELRHCHLVSLFGYCNHEKEMILIYEYMPNGTLDDHLHKLGSPLSWLQRLNICIGAARGLHYLHTGTGIEFGVIHRDVKSSNILLHESWAAKISDFGLSRIAPANHRSTYVNTHVKGTFGYIDPDYFYSGRLTRKSDVFAFGVILLEVLCRKRAVDTSLDEDQWNLAKWAQESIKKGNLKHIIDSDIRGQISPKCLKEFVRIADKCLHTNPKQRSTMAEVVVSLESVVALQEKIYLSLQNAGTTLFGRMVDMFAFSSKGEISAKRDSKLSSHSKGKSRCAGNNVGAANKDFTVPNPNLKAFKFADLKMATRNFSQDLILGTGGYGDVFKGWVDKNSFAPSEEGVGIAVAVKLYTGGKHRNAEWQRVVSILGELTHPSIISLLGYCDDTKDKHFLLVYEYMQNRDLGHVLHKDASEPLSWETRIVILIGVARGLAYLHSSKCQVIHRDVKSSNILLDQGFNAKLGDFGLVTFGPEDEDTHVSTRVMGTIGYLAPEYAMRGNLSVKADIYSFGVVLLETLTGRKVWDYFSPAEEQVNLIEWAISIQSERRELKEIMDPRLELNYPEEGASQCIALALRCIEMSPRDRPSSEEILLNLEQIYSDKENSGTDNNYLTTINISRDMLLGKGRYGEVFIGWVDKNRYAPSTEGVGIAVSVKRYHEGDDQPQEEWQTVVSILGQLAHPNIISLLGYCNHTKNEHLLLDCEYIQNQSLSHLLHGDAADVAQPLSWGTRLNIMIGIARGLAYLHSSKENVQIIHCNVKSSHILLDQDFNAKLGGLGSPKHGPEIRETYATAKFIGSTLGYLDPDYFHTGQLSMKSDVYSFGVVLLETLTGHKPYDPEQPREVGHLVNWVTGSILENRRKLKEIMDPRLEHNYSQEAAFECASLALRCVSLLPKDRPSSEEVVQSLEHIHAVYK